MSIGLKKYYGIKFPFTINNLDGFFIDLNKTIEDKVASEIVHVILTPKRTRIRMPEFGTDLIKFIFEPNDDLSWAGVKSEIIESVGKYVPGVELNNIEIIKENGDDHNIYLDLRYSVKVGASSDNNRLVVKI